MKTKTIFTMAALAAVLAGCSDNEDMTLHNNYPADGVIRMNVAVNDPQTRATYSDNGTLKDFRIIVDNPQNDKYTYNSFLVEYQDNTGWTPAKQMLWANETDEVTIIAYKSDVASPDYTAGTTDVPVNIQTEQGLDDNMLKSDFLFFKQSKFRPDDNLNDDGKVDIHFQHVLSKLTLTINLGTELNEPAVPLDNPITKLKIKGTAIVGTINFNTAGNTEGRNVPSVTTAGDNGEVSPLYKVYTPAENENKEKQGSVTYECILIPQIVESGFSVSFKVGEKNYEWVSNGTVELQPGTAHTLTLLAGKEVVLIGDITAGKWEEVTDTSIETE